MTQHVAFVGFGEAAAAFVEGWGSSASRLITAYDIKTESEHFRTQKLEDYSVARVSGHELLQDALAGATVIFSLVTADQAGAAAEAVASCIKGGPVFLDCNSCSPDTKKNSAQHIEEAGGRYVDVAVMAPVYPLLHEVPLLISGPHADAVLGIFSELKMHASVVSGGVGASSSIKMIRSIMIKGLEALSAECFLAARKAGVDQAVMASLDQSLPAFLWPEKSAYMLERMMVHGVRRAAEMREVALTLEQLGLSSAMASATAQWQQDIGELGLLPESGEFGPSADTILKQLQNGSMSKGDRK